MNGALRQTVRDTAFTPNQSRINDSSDLMRAVLPLLLRTEPT